MPFTKSNKFHVEHMLPYLYTHTLPPELRSMLSCSREEDASASGLDISD